MSAVWITSLVALWVLVLVDVALTLRVVRWLRSMKEAQKFDAHRRALPELPTGEPAPPFRARDLAGRPVELADHAGHEALFVFVSPHCGPCRRELPELVRLGAAARAAAGAQLTLVVDARADEARAWLRDVREEDGVEVDLPVLAAGGSEFLATYNPRAESPYFAHVDPGGVLMARGIVNDPGWTAIKRRWSGGTARRPLGRRFS